MRCDYESPVDLSSTNIAYFGIYGTDQISLIWVKSSPFPQVLGSQPTGVTAQYMDACESFVFDCESFKIHLLVKTLPRPTESLPWFDCSEVGICVFRF